MAIDQVAARREVDTPQAVEDLFASHQAARVGRQEIEQALLDRGEMEFAGSRTNATMKDIDLEPAELDRGRERNRRPIGPSRVTTW